MRHWLPSHALQRTRPSRSGCNPRVPPAGSPSFCRSVPDRTNDRREYEIIDTNVENLGGCSFCGRTNPNSERYRRKPEWLEDRYAEGLGVKTGSDLLIPHWGRRQPRENVR